MNRDGAERRTRALAAALLLTAAALVGAGLVQAEVVGRTTPAADPPAPVIHDEPVVLECWQQGRRIIRKTGLQGLAVKAVTRKDAVAFKPMDDTQPEIFLLPFDDGLCLVAPKG